MKRSEVNRREVRPGKFIIMSGRVVGRAQQGMTKGAGRGAGERCFKLTLG